VNAIDGLSNEQVEELAWIKDQFLADEAAYAQLMNQASDKGLKVLISFVYNLISYVLHKRGKHLKTAEKTPQSPPQ
jgi:phage terminase Nu1 subunit (DNA packaging protein)